MPTTEYAKAYKLAQKQVKEAAAAGESAYPAVLEERLESWTAGQGVSLGVLDIPTALIAGTCTRGRQNLFSRGFLPLAKEGSEFATKWEALYASQVSEGMRDPIVAYEYLQRFYVQEGNKRVSVARTLGMPSIEAQVTRVLPKPEIGEDYDHYQAFLAFWKVCPLYGLEFADAASFEKFAQLLGLGLEEPWPEEDVLRLKAFLVLFEECLSELKGGPQDELLGDGLLTYLKFYPGHSSTPVAKSELVDRLKQIWSKPSTAAKAAKAVVAAGQGAVTKAMGLGVAKVAGAVGGTAAQVVHSVASSTKTAGEYGEGEDETTEDEGESIGREADS